MMEWLFCATDTELKSQESMRPVSAALYPEFAGKRSMPRRLITACHLYGDPLATVTSQLVDAARCSCCLVELKAQSSRSQQPCLRASTGSVVPRQITSDRGHSMVKGSQYAVPLLHSRSANGYINCACDPTISSQQSLPFASHKNHQQTPIWLRQSPLQLLLLAWSLPMQQLSSLAITQLWLTQYVRLQPIFDSTLTLFQKSLIDTLEIENLYARAEKLQEIAYSTKGKNRAIGTEGHEKTVEYIKSQLDTDYYDVYTQEVPLNIGYNASLTVNNKTVEAFATTLAPGGNATGPLIAIDNLGCNEVCRHVDYYVLSTELTNPLGGFPY
jgi:hypothetical protein